MAEVSNTTAMSDMPQYRCHKVVRAAKIGKIERFLRVVDDGAFLHLFTEAIPLEVEAGVWLKTALTPVRVPREYVEKHKPQVGGYFVVYEDGYQSFSPAEAFESGYTRV